MPYDPKEKSRQRGIRGGGTLWTTGSFTIFNVGRSEGEIAATPSHERIREWFEQYRDVWLMHAIEGATVSHDLPHGELLIAGMRETFPSQATELRTLHHENTALLLERERVKTRLISSQRELLDVRQQTRELHEEVNHLRHQNNGQLDCILEFTRANVALQQVLITRDDGRLAMHEHNRGVVIECSDDEVAVRYETPDGALDQVYDKSQFVQGQLPEQGDRVEAHVFMWRRPHEPKGIDRFFTPEEIEDARRAFQKGVTGPIES